MSDRLPPRVVVGSQALAALVVPARYAIVNHLLAAGPQTASQCAAVVGETASNCSWHLRALARVRLVGPVTRPHGDARTRPWQAAAVGFTFGGEPPGPAGLERRRHRGHPGLRGRAPGRRPSGSQKIPAEQVRVWTATERVGTLR